MPTDRADRDGAERYRAHGDGPEGDRPDRYGAKAPDADRADAVGAQAAAAPSAHADGAVALDAVHPPTVGRLSLVGRQRRVREPARGRSASTHRRRLVGRTVDGERRQRLAGAAANESFAGRLARDGAGSAIARPPRGPLSQPYLRRVVSKLKGCLSSLPARQSEVLVLRTGTGLRRSYTRAQVAKILHVTVAQEGRLEHQAVTGLGKASVGSRLRQPGTIAPAGGVADHARRNELHPRILLAERAPAGAPVSAAPKAAPKRSHARPKHAPAPPKTTSPGTAAAPGAPASFRRTTAASPGCMLALMIAAGTAALMLIFAYLRQQPRDQCHEGSARPVARAPAPGRRPRRRPRRARSRSPRAHARRRRRGRPPARHRPAPPTRPASPAPERR